MAVHFSHHHPLEYAALTVDGDVLCTPEVYVVLELSYNNKQDDINYYQLKTKVGYCIFTSMVNINYYNIYYNVTK